MGRFKGSHSYSGSQAWNPFSEHGVKGNGCVITSKQIYYSQVLGDEWIKKPCCWTFLRRHGPALIHQWVEGQVGFRACALLCYSRRQFSFVCCSLALKQVLASGLSGQQCINHINPTAGEATTKGRDLMSSAECSRRVNAGLDRALKHSTANSLSATQSKHFSTFFVK